MRRAISEDRGVMIVSEPPDDTDSQRWNIEKLAELGLSAEGRRRHGAAYQSS